MSDEETGLHDAPPTDAEAPEAITADAEALFRGPPPEIRAERLASRDWTPSRLTRTKPLALRPAILAGLALAALAGLISALTSTPAQTAAARVKPHPIVPRQGQSVPNGAAVTGSCLTVNRHVTNELRGWGVYTIDPGQPKPNAGGVQQLAPSDFTGFTTPPGLDAYASTSTRPTGPTQWQVGSGGRQLPSGPGADCRRSLVADAPDVTISGAAVTPKRPGPYVYWTLDNTVHWTRVPRGAADPTPRPCPGNANPASSAPAYPGSPPPGGSGWHWAIDQFCTEVKWRGFYVLGAPGRCPASGDMSNWPRSGYINQYAAGARLGLPVGRGAVGGNACGPAALLMAMLASERSVQQQRDTRATDAAIASLPTLAQVFDGTMRHPRGGANAKAANDFEGSKAAAFLRQFGWNSSDLKRLDARPDPANLSVIDSAANNQPIVISTSFGPGPWGTTGSGHMMVVLGRSPSDPGEYVVYDPAGNYFSSPTAHYGPGSCGYAVLYPASWLLAYTTGAWYLQLGAPSASATPQAPARRTTEPSAGSGLRHRRLARHPVA